MGARNVKLYVNKSLVFDGQLLKGTAEAPAGQSIPVSLQSHKSDRPEKLVQAHGRDGTDTSEPDSTTRTEAQGARGTLLTKKATPVSVSKVQPVYPESAKAGVSKPECQLSMPTIAPALSEECPPQPPALETLAGRKASDSQGGTPSWLQPSPSGQDQKAKPLWLIPETPLDWKGPGKGFREAEAPESNKGSWHEQGRANDRPQRTPARARSEDLDVLFHQPSHREHPTSGRRGCLRRDPSIKPGDSQPASRGEHMIQAPLDTKPLSVGTL